MANKKDYIGAFEKYRKALEIDSNHVDAYNSWGVDLLNMGKPNEAISKLGQALLLNPTDPVVHYNVGRSLVKLKRFKEAKIHFELSLTINPNDADVYKFLGFTLDSLGDAEGAAAAYQRGLEIKSGSK